MDSGKLAVVLQLVGIGWYVAISIGGGAFGGLLLDRWLDVAPLFTLLGLGLGIAVGVFGMVRMLLAVIASENSYKAE